MLEAGSGSQARMRRRHGRYYAARQPVPALIADERAPYAWERAISPDQAPIAGDPATLRRLRSPSAGNPASNIQPPASHRTDDALALTATPISEKLTEAQLTTLWRGRRFPAAALVTRAGVPVTVIHQGRPGRGAGPDFRDAVIAGPSGLPLRGDIELHVRASLFRAHGHATDPAYANVILHVVFDDEGEAETVLPGGRSAPVIALRPWVAQRAGELERWLQQPLLWREPCFGTVARLGAAGAAAALDSEGDRRFLARSERVAEVVKTEGIEQALYQGLLEALGYGGNAPQMLLLARSLPWTALCELVPANDRRREGFEALLLGSAGLLPSQRGGDRTAAGRAETRTQRTNGHEWPQPPHDAARLDQYVTELERAFTQQRRPLPAPSPRAWKLWGVRPENAPARRIAAAAALLDALGTPSALLRMLDATTVNEAIAPLTAAKAGGYWLTHYDLCAPRCRLPPGFIGRLRALEIIINVVLPAAVATGDGERARALFARLPRPAAYGSTKFIEAALASGGERVPINARRSQGLLALNKDWCTQGGCGRCPLS